jgi:hypothetical protein
MGFVWELAILFSVTKAMFRTQKLHQNVYDCGLFLCEYQSGLYQEKNQRLNSGVLSKLENGSVLHLPSAVLISLALIIVYGNKWCHLSLGSKFLFKKKFYMVKSQVEYSIVRIVIALFFLSL